MDNSPATQAPQYKYCNPIQQVANLVAAQETICVLGRGTGKTTGIAAHRVDECTNLMPRSAGAMIGRTYRQILVRTLPSLLLGLTERGYMEERDYRVGKAPPKDWPRPYLSPQDYGTFVSFRNGAGMHLASQDRPGLVNSLSLDWIIGDEARLLKHDLYQEDLLPALRGNVHYFGHLGQHHSILLTTDKPRTAEGRWITEEKKHAERDLPKIEAIKKLVVKRWQLTKSHYLEGKPLGPHTLKRLAEIDNYLARLRHGCVHYIEASSLANIHVLGIDYIRQQMRNLSPSVFQSSILNLDVREMEAAFYPDLSREQHGYYASDNNRLERTHHHEVARLRWAIDTDLDTRLPLDIALDYGKFNALVIGQPHGHDYRFLNAMHVHTPDVITDLIARFLDYYDGYPTRRVNYYYDHTATGETGLVDATYAEVVMRELRKKGWHVNEMHIGKAPRHEERANLWSEALRGGQDRYPTPRFNLDNTEDLLTSMLETGIRPRSQDGGYQKDKSLERKDIDQTHAPHYSDAADTLLWGRLMLGDNRMRT